MSENELASHKRFKRLYDRIIDEGKRVLVSDEILIYALDISCPERPHTSSVVRDIIETKLDAVIPAICLVSFFDKSLAFGASPRDVYHFIDLLVKFLPEENVPNLTLDVLLRGCSLAMEYGIEVSQSLVFAHMEKLDINYIVSHNASFDRMGVVRIDPVPWR